MIRCKSIQRDERGKAEEVVLETPGVYGEDENCRYLTYEETSLSGMEGTTTTIRMYEDHVTLSRQGSFLQETEYRPGIVADSPPHTMPRSPSRNSPTPSPVPAIRLEAKVGIRVDSPEANKGRRAMAMARGRRMPARRQWPPLVPMWPRSSLSR